MNKLVQILIGLILLVLVVSLAVLNIWSVGTAMWVLLKGGIAWIILMISVILIIAGLTEFN
jgi:hypothetical protein